MSKRRERLTNRVASPPPATPGYPEYDGWKDKHPAAQPDPNWEQYANGDPSSWAEDPRTGPYPNSEHPATPWEGSDHPAAKPDHMTGITKSEWTKTEKKAYQCVRVASAMLGKGASQQQVEKQALSLMSVSDNQLLEMSRRMEASGFMLADDMDMEDEVMGCGDSMYPEDDDLDMDSDMYMDDDSDIMALDQNDPEYFYEDDANGPVGFDDEEDMYAMMLREGDKSRMAAEISELRAELAALKRQASMTLEDQMLAEMLKEETQRYASEEDRMLDEMLREAAKKAEDEESEEEESEESEEESEGSDKEASFDKEAEALLAEMQREAGKKAEDDEEESEEESKENESEESEEESDKEAAFDQDPMGLWDITDHGHDPILSQLYGDRIAAEEEEESEEESEEDKEASKKKAKDLEIELYPQPRLASDGVRTLGNVSKTASSQNKELEALWSSAPDVSDIF